MESVVENIGFRRCGDGRMAVRECSSRGDGVIGSDGYAGADYELGDDDESYGGGSGDFAAWKEI